MNDLLAFIMRKGLEKATIYALKEEIIKDNTLSRSNKEFWISFLDGVSIANDVCDIITIIKNNSNK